MYKIDANDFVEGEEGRNLSLLTEFFKMLGNPTRIRILFILMEHESCVGELAGQLALTQSAVSHQLNLLKSSKLVRQRRDGKMIFYSLSDNHVRMVVETGVEHMLERQPSAGKKV